MQHYLSNQEERMELLVKYIAGEALPEEAMAVEDWIQASAANKQQYEELVAAWNAAAVAAAVHKIPDVQKEWTQFKTKVERPVVRKLHPKTAIYYLAAACVLLLAGILGWFLFSESNNASQHAIVIRSSNVFTHEKLPDLTQVVLDANSSISYSNADFNERARTIALKGEGFFKVTHNPQKPFIIDMEGISLQVLGTSFRVENDSVAQEVLVEVATGKVMLYNEADTLVLAAGQSGVYNRKDKKLSRLNTIDINNFSYATKQFSFTDLPLDKVAKHLEKTYGVTIRFNNAAITTCRLSAQFDQQPLEEIFDVIASTFGITYQVNGKTILIDGKGCK